MDSSLEAIIKRLDEVRDKEVRRIDEENSRQNERLKVLEDKVHNLNSIITSIEKMATHMETIDKELAEQGERVERLEDKDGDMWRTLVKYIVMTIVGAVIGYVFVRLGMK